MSMVSFINVISHRAKFPLSYTKGSEKQRNKMAANLTQKVYDGIKESSSNSLSTEQLHNIIAQVLSPHDINFVVTTNPKSLGNLADIIDVKLYSNSIDYIIKNFGKKNIPNLPNKPFVLAFLEGFELKIKPNKNGQISDFYTAIHEVRHFFDHLCNPKISVMRRNVVANMTDEQVKKYCEMNDLIFDINTTKDFSTIKDTVTKDLEIIPQEFRTDVLQGIRNRLKTEINAYHQELRIKSKTPISQFRAIVSDINLLRNQAKFKSKLKFINKLLKEHLQKERGM